MVTSDEILRVIVKLGTRLFSVKADQVVSMEVLSELSEIPQAPSYIRGVAELRGQLIPVVDLRQVLGLGNYQEDLEKLSDIFSKGEKDFFKIITSFKANIGSSEMINLKSIQEDFTFSVWLKNYESDNIFISEICNSLKRRNLKILEKLKEVNLYLENNKRQEANEAFSDIENDELPKLKEIFKNTHEVIRDKSNELFIVIQQDESKFAVTVDHIEAVDLIEQAGDTEDTVFSFLNPKLKELIECIGRNKRFDDLIICLNIEMLYKHLNIGTVV